MNIFRGIKLHQILIIILLVTLIFIAFQLFIFNKLSISNKIIIINDKNDDNLRKYIEKIEIKEDYLINKINETFHKHSIKNEYLEINFKQKQEQNLNSQEIEKIFSKSINKLNQTLELFFHYHVVKYSKENNKNVNSGNAVENSYLKGVNKNDIDLYKSDENGQFTCLKSKEKISFKLVNDDYCDCIDGSDEPGTSACPNSLFFCDFQHDYLDNHYIPSSKVNDGICDCCDGSDEYLHDSKCELKCKEKLEKAKKNYEMRNSAKMAKKPYLIEGQSKSETLYGPEGVFYKLSKSCFHLKHSEFTYDVCPYVSITQKSHSNSMNIGTQASLIFEDSNWVLHMSNGDSRLCTKSRHGKIILNCDLNESLTRVEEPEQCVYAFYLNTPAAC